MRICLGLIITPRLRMGDAKAADENLDGAGNNGTPPNKDKHTTKWLMRICLGLAIMSRLRKRDTTAVDENLKGADNDVLPNRGRRQCSR